MALKKVAPHTGAWIETSEWFKNENVVRSRPSHRGVDRNRLIAVRGSTVLGRPSHRGVDRNCCQPTIANPRTGRPSHRGVDRNISLSFGQWWRDSRPSHRGVDRNLPVRLAPASEMSVAPHTGAWIETHSCPVQHQLVMSPLTQGRGSKRLSSASIPAFCIVAPHTGAWIETRNRDVFIQAPVVAPHTGAWIETS